MIICSCPSAEQVSILLSSASILAAEGIINFSAAARRLSNASTITDAYGPNSRKTSLEKKVSFDGVAPAAAQLMANVPEVSESADSSAAASPINSLAKTPVQTTATALVQSKDEELAVEAVEAVEATNVWVWITIYTAYATSI